MQIFVKTIKRTITLDVKLNDSIQTVKEQIKAREGIPMSYISLIYAGKQLEEGHSLNDYDI